MVLQLPVDVLRIAIPLAIYFVVMVFVSFAMGKFILVPVMERQRPQPVINFELAIAVAIATFGLNSAIAFTMVIGPLVEVPVLILLVNVAFWLRMRWFLGTTLKQ